MIRISVFLAAILMAAPMRADLAAVKAETKLDKRARKALDNADQALKTAEDAYRSGSLKESQSAFQEVGESVLLANDALKGTGKNPSRSPRHFKDAEIRTRELMRKLADFGQQMSFEDRGAVESVRATVEKVHEELLQAIMGGKKKR